MNNIKQNLFSPALWIRILYMIVFYFVSKLAFMLVVLITIIQALYKLITGNILQPAWEFSHSLNSYILQIIDFLTFCTEDKPFPFSNWPPTNKKDDIIIDYDHKESHE